MDLKKHNNIQWYTAYKRFFSPKTHIDWEWSDKKTFQANSNNNNNKTKTGVAILRQSRLSTKNGKKRQRSSLYKVSIH